MDTTARVGTAVAAGYMFGRFKKLRLALMVGTVLASEDARKTAVGLVQHGVGGLGSGGAAGKLAGQAGSKLMDVGRGAAVAAASSRLERLSDRLAERTASLGGQSRVPTQRAGQNGEPEDSYEDAEEYEDEAEEAPEEEAEEAPEDEAADYDDSEDEDEYDEAEDEYEDDAEYEDEEAEDEEPAPRARRTGGKARTGRRSRALSPAGAGGR